MLQLPCLYCQSGLYEKLGPIYVTTEKGKSNVSQGVVFYTNHQLAYENHRMQMQEAVHGMPLFEKLVAIFGPKPTATTLFELGMVTMGAPTLVGTGCIIGEYSRPLPTLQAYI